MKRVAFITYRIIDAKNRNAFQKPYRLCKKYKTDIFAKERIGSPCEIDQHAFSINILAGYEKTYPIIFPIWAIYRILRSQGFKSRIYTDWHNTSLLTGFFLSVLGATWVADIWDDPKKRLLSWEEKNANVPIYKRTYHEIQGSLISCYLKRADLVVSCVPKLDQIYKINKKKIIFHSNGVDLELTKLSNNDKKNNKKEFCILYVGPIETVRLKNIKSLIVNIYREIKNFEIKLVGPISDEIFVQNIKADLPEEIAIYFTGWMNHNEVLLEISKAHVCLLPYPDAKEIKYYRPIKLFEYMAMGKIVVASRLPGIEKVVKDGRTGFLYDPHDTKKAAKIINEIRSNPGLEEIIGKNAKSEMKKYDWSNIVGKVFKKLPFND